VGIRLPEEHDPFPNVDRPTHSQLPQNIPMTKYTPQCHCTSKAGRYAMGLPSTFF
jgi:hypothetical protein